MTSDGIYFRERADVERTAALRATHPTARRRHCELAQLYDDLALAAFLKSRVPTPQPFLQD